MEAPHSADKRPTKLNDVQITLLRMFNRDMTEREISEVRKLILDYYDEKLDAELNKVVAEKGYNKEDYNTILNNQNRTELKQEITQKRDAGSH
ncbi:hypothetical protein BH09BAC4_BH09BAC4_15530 [soil metagenome]